MATASDSASTGPRSTSFAAISRELGDPSEGYPSATTEAIVRASLFVPCEIRSQRETKSEVPMLLFRTFQAPAVSSAASLFGTLRRGAGRITQWCARCQARYEQRQDLAALDERLLKDVGITASEATRESAKPWWRA